MTTEREIAFEEAMTKLEQIVERLESGEVPLEQAVELFQEGMELSRICGMKLDQVEHKIEMLTEENGNMVKRPFAVDETEQEEQA